MCLKSKTRLDTDKYIKNMSKNFEKEGQYEQSGYSDSL